MSRLPPAPAVSLEQDSCGAISPSSTGWVQVTREALVLDYR